MYQNVIKACCLNNHSNEIPIEGKTLDIQASKVYEEEVFLLQENKIILIKGRNEKETIAFKHASTVFDVSANDTLFAIGNDVLKIEEDMLMLINLDFFESEEMCFWSPEKARILEF